MNIISSITVAILGAILIVLLLAGVTLAIFSLREWLAKRMKTPNPEGFRIAKIKVFRRDSVHLGSFYSGIRVVLIAVKTGHVAAVSVYGLAGEFYPEGAGHFRLNTQSLKSMSNTLEHAFCGLFHHLKDNPPELVQKAIAEAISNIVPSSPYTYSVSEGTKGEEWTTAG